MNKKILVLPVMALAVALLVSGCKKEAAPASSESAAQTTGASGAVYEAEAEITIDLSGSGQDAAAATAESETAAQEETPQDNAEASSAETPEDSSTAE